MGLYRTLKKQKSVSSNKIKIGVAGLGRIGWNFHCTQLSAHKDFLLTACADPAADRALEAKKTFGAAAYTDFFEMIRSEDLDAVVIAAPTHLHKEMAIAALEKNLHVILEKPMALNTAESKSIAAKAKSKKKVLTVYQPHRLAAYYQQMLALTKQKTIGKVYWVQRASFNYARRNDWQSLKKFGGGMLYNYGAHFIDSVMGIVGYASPIKRIFCDLQRCASIGDAEDVVKIIIETESGVLADVSISQASVIAPYDFIIWGTHGAIMLNGLAEGKPVISLKYFKSDTLPAKKLEAQLASTNRAYPSDTIKYIEKKIPVDQKYQINVFSDFARAIRTDKKPYILPEETLCVMSILERCEKDSKGISAF